MRKSNLLFTILLGFFLREAFAQTAIVEIVLSKPVFGIMAVSSSPSKYVSDEFFSDDGIHGIIECTEDKLGEAGTASITYSFRSNPTKFTAVFNEYCWPLMNILKSTGPHWKTKFTVVHGTDSVKLTPYIQD